jgi:hypothetical protein
MGRKQTPMEDRFLAHIEKTDSCWLWKGAINKKNGYGYFGLGTRADGIDVSHKVAYRLWNGEIPAGHQVRHKCKNRNCVNPEHLETGTARENALDRHRDGTMPTRLVAEQVLEIRRRKGENLRVLGEEFGVGKSGIWLIQNGYTWTHI